MVEASDKVDYLAYWPHLDTTLTQEMSGKATIAGVTVRALIPCKHTLNSYLHHCRVMPP